MAVIVSTSRPSSLLAAIKAKIDDKSIETWFYDSDGDFNHTPPQWEKKAWLRPRIESERLTFGILSPKDIKMTKTVYAVYHGRFIEMLLAHFDEQLTQVYASAQATGPDLI